MIDRNTTILTSERHARGLSGPALMLVGLSLLAVPATAVSETLWLSPGQSIQKAIDKSARGDVLVLRDGVYHEAVDIHKSIMLRAEHGGEATITNRFAGPVTWKQIAWGSKAWYASDVDWPVHRLLVEGMHTFDYRTKENFDNRECGPYWSKGWQAGKSKNLVPPIYFAHDAPNNRLWLKLDDTRDPNEITIDFNSANLDGITLVQKDLGAYWNQQQIVTISRDPPVHPITLWYAGTEKAPLSPKKIDFPKICGIVVEINADNVTLEGLRIHLAPTVGVEVNNSQDVTIRDCYFSGYQFAVNTGYECTKLTVTHCEMDGGKLVSFGGHRNVTNNMWNHSTYVNPIKFNGTGLTFKHNYVYEGYDLFHPRGRHKDFLHVPDLRSDVAFNVWQNAIDNAIEFDGVEARMNMRFHHNLILQNHDALAITTTEDGGPLTIDHNLWWPGGGRIMKLVGTGRRNSGVEFVHNTYFTGSRCSHNGFGASIFENNIVLSGCQQAGCWSPERLEAFFPTRFNLLQNGDRYTADFGGLTSDPLLGTTPQTRFVLQPGSPAIDAGRSASRYFQDNVTDGKPDPGALEHGQDIDDWRSMFGHCGPRWISLANWREKSPHRPAWPVELDKRWGGLDASEVAPTSR